MKFRDQTSVLLSVLVVRSLVVIYWSRQEGQSLPCCWRFVNIVLLPYSSARYVSLALNLYPSFLVPMSPCVSYNFCLFSSAGSYLLCIPGLSGPRSHICHTVFLAPGKVPEDAYNPQSHTRYVHGPMGGQQVDLVMLAPVICTSIRHGIWWPTVSSASCVSSSFVLSSFQFCLGDQ